MKDKIYRAKRIAYGGLAVGACLVLSGAAASSDPLTVSAIAAGVFLLLSWGYGEIVSRTLLRRAAIRDRLFVSVYTIVMIGALIYGALETGFRYGSSSSASWLISIGLIVLSLAAAALTGAVAVARRDHDRDPSDVNRR